MIKTTEYIKRRKQLMRIAGKNTITILSSAPVKIRNGDVHHYYRQDSDFYYLSGFNEPEAVMVLLSDGSNQQQIMFCREADPKKIIWDGPMAGVQGMVDDYGFDEAYDINEINRRLPLLMAGCEKVCFKIGDNDEFDHNLAQWVKAIDTRAGVKSNAPEEFMSISHIIHDMRLYKSHAEIRCMKKSAEIAAQAHIRMMQNCQPAMFEYQLQAEYQYELMNNNSHSSYPPIIGSGENNNIMHYINNNKRMNDGELVLVDAGAEYDFYASDVTRTYPVNGTFNARQKDLYELVLQAQSDAIDQVKVGKHWIDFHDAAAKTISQGLLDLKILKGSLDQVLEEKTYTQYYMHMTGHWLGLDVHDVGDYRVDDLWVELEENMVLTVEPGLYISENSKAPKKWRGMGVRIEDDVQVSKKGPVILSKSAPKTVAEIEHTMRG
ncbi:aminopeptidase P N-terminal domain-containing protein [Marinicella sp. S1101]|uniref:aminopeptidase P N-terminal domain-containing protein n=1 Tax=Marinicella marina TaxID=2996016 RepID=UPI0022608BEB|nr:aminopeptidase P N-terminal domain-containing protein [Marinicella marina]MCX7553433.1 aminopeptidase P N-terminal domain-containing protein [Marinicella marina]MDJ1140057.1 aminopeptidase P N-terminal domain-containing protein [Marinicella marina]